MRIFLIILGIVLLLPGLCSLAFTPMFLQSPDIGIIWLPGILLGGLGVWLILKGGKKKGPDNEPS